MQISRRILLDDFLKFVNAYGDTAKRDQAKALLNRVLEKIWMLRGWECFIDPTVWEFDTTASVRDYALPDHFGRVSGENRIIRNLTNAQQIYPADRNDIEAEDPTVGTSLEVPGQPTRYTIQGTTPVQTQPASTGEALEVVSDNASDTSARVFISGLTTSNLVAQREETLNGTTAVAVGTWARILKFGKAYPEGSTPTTALTSSRGNVTLRKVSDATQLQILASWQDAREHQTIALTPIPASVYTIGVPILRAIEPTFYDSDPMPPNWTNAVFDGLVHFWRVGDHDVSEDGSGMWPSLKELIEHDNALRAQGKRNRRSRAFMGI